MIPIVFLSNAVCGIVMLTFFVSCTSQAAIYFFSNDSGVHSADIVCLIAGALFYGMVLTPIAFKERAIVTLSSLWRADAMTAGERSLKHMRCCNKSYHDACPICLVEFRDDELVVCGAICDHGFHQDCMLQWMQSASNGCRTCCPLCRQELLTVEKRRGSSTLDLPIVVLR